MYANRGFMRTRCRFRSVFISNYSYFKELQISWLYLIKTSIGPVPGQKLKISCHNDFYNVIFILAVARALGMDTDFLFSNWQQLRLQVRDFFIRIWYITSYSCMRHHVAKIATKFVTNHVAIKEFAIIKKMAACRWKRWFFGEFEWMEITVTWCYILQNFIRNCFTFLWTFACESCPVCWIIGRVNRYPRCSDMSISLCSWAVKNPVFNRRSRSVDSRIHTKEV